MMSFEIEGKIALISGGASGIGFSCAKDLLRNGLRGIVLADNNDECGINAVKEINEEFGVGKVLFVKTDVSNKDNYEDAFKQTIDHYKNLDILINNAGIMNETMWEREVAVNLNGTINGILLANEYIPKYRTSEEGIIVNMASIAGLDTLCSIPIYSATKFASRALTIAFGHQVHYSRTNIRVFAICPGLTDTAITNDMHQKVLGPEYYTILEEELIDLKSQQSSHVSESLVKLIKTAKSGTLWVVEGEDEAYEFVENKNR